MHIHGRRYRVGPRVVRRLAAAVALGALLAVGSAARQAWTVHQRIEAVRRELHAQRLRNAELEQALAEATSLRSIERRARQDLGLVRPGERVVEPAVPVPPDDPFRVPRRPNRPADVSG